MEKRFGIIGDPVAGSLSPLLFGAAYGGKYGYDLIEGADFDASWEKFLREYDGVNVTAPFKEKACLRADAVTDGVRQIGAANLAVKTEKGIEAHNTDFSGVILSCAAALSGSGDGVQDLAAGTARQALVYVRDRIGRLYRGRRPAALIAGCGGAGRAAAMAAAEMGYATTLMNRTVEKAAAIASDMAGYGFSVEPIENFREAVRRSDLIIYTVPSAIDGIEQLEASDLAGKSGCGGPCKLLLEANYKNPVFPEILRRADAGPYCRYISGKSWLLYQAVAGYGTLVGEAPDFAAMRNALF